MNVALLATAPMRESRNSIDTLIPAGYLLGPIWRVQKRTNGVRQKVP
jgi:hypothetical protein